MLMEERAVQRGRGGGMEDSLEWVSGCVCVTLHVRSLPGPRRFSFSMHARLE